MSMTWKPGKGGEVPKIGVDFAGDKGRTIQGPSAACDINAIVRRYKKTGFLEHVRKTPGVFADVSQFGDFHSMVSKVTEARSVFAQLPSELRKRFHNDPAELVVFMGDSANAEEAISLGLMSKPKGVGDPPEAAPAADGGRPVDTPPVKEGGSPEPS